MKLVVLITDLSLNALTSMKSILGKATYAIVILSLLTACSRPYATLQRTPVNGAQTTIDASTSPITVAAENLTQASAEQVGTPTQAAITPTTIQESIAQSEALVAADHRLTATQKNTLTKRMNRIRHVMSAATLADVSGSKARELTHKPTVLERIVVKKMDKQIQRKLSPQQPQLNVGMLSTGAVLVLVGLLLVLLTSGTAATLGIVGLIVGAVLLLLGLL